MSKIMSLLKRARQYELEISAQAEHIERLHRIGRIARESSEYALEILEKLRCLERELNEQIDKTVDVKRKALGCISILEGEERAVIEQYYILGEDWQTIADKLYTSERRVFMLRKSALKRLEQAVQKEAIWVSDIKSENSESAGA